MASRIIVDYTEKEFKGFKADRFNSIADAEKWIKENQEKLYWTNIRMENAISSKQKVIVSEDEDLSEFIKVEGILETYFETGMECLGLTLQDPTQKGQPNPNFDPNKPEGGSNFQFYASYEGLHFIENGDILQIEGQSKFRMVKDREFAKDDGYRLSFYPQGFSRDELVKLFSPQSVKASIWKRKRES